MTNHEQLCKEFCQLNNIHWHEWFFMNRQSGDKCACGKYKYAVGDNPTFSDAKSILEVMMKRKDYRGDFGFQQTLSPCGGYDCIAEDYVLNPDKILLTAVEWCREHNGGVK